MPFVNPELKREAVEMFGKETVDEVLMMVAMSDPDGAWALYKDFDDEDKVECIEFLFF